MRKTLTNITICTGLLVFIGTTSSCSLFKPKYGCPSDGKNIGAEKLVNGDPEAVKAAKKAKKFRN